MQLDEQVISSKNLNGFPDEILLAIFAYLSPIELVTTILLVDKNLRQIGLDDKLWITYLQLFFNWPSTANNHYELFANSYKTTYSLLSPKVKPFFRHLAEGNIRELSKFKITLDKLEHKNKGGMSLLEVMGNRQEIFDYFYQIAVAEYSDHLTHLIQPDLKDHFKRNLLHWATRFNQAPETIETLISLGCSQEPAENWGRPLHIAVFHDYTNIIQSLLAKGENANNATNGYLLLMDSTTGLISLRPKEEVRVSGSISPINIALANSHYKTVQVLLESGASFDESSLCYATLSGSMELILLVRATFPSTQSLKSYLSAEVYYHDDNLLPTYLGVTVLHIAAALGYEEIVIYYLNLDMDVNSETQEYSNFTSLQLAAQNGHFDVVKALLSRGAKIDEYNVQGSSLLLAVKGGHEEIALHLSNRGADQTKGTGDQWLPIHFAADRGNYNIFSHLLNRNPELIQAKTAKGETLLHLAAGSGSIETVRLILAMNAIAIDSRITSSYIGNNITPLFYALEKGHETIAKLLMDNGASLEAVINYCHNSRISTLPYFESAFRLLTGGSNVRNDEITRIGPNLMAFAVNCRNWDWVHFLREKYQLKPTLSYIPGKVTVADLTTTKLHYQQNSRSFFSLFGSSKRKQAIASINNAKDDYERFERAQTFISENQDDQFAISLYESIPRLLA